MTVATTRLLSPAFVLAMAVNFLQGLSFFMFIHFPRFLTGLGADEVTIGLVVAVAAIASILLRPAVATLMDSRGRRLAVLIGGLMNTAAVPLYFTVTAVGPWLYAVRVLHGLASALTFTAITTYGADHAPEGRRTQGLALFAASSMLPAAVGGWVGDLVLEAGGFRGVLFAALGFAVTALALSTLLPGDRVVPTAETLPRRPGAFWRAAAQSDLVPIWMIGFAVSLAMMAYSTFLRTFVDETGVGSVGLFFAAYAGTAVVLRLFGGWLPDRVGRDRVFYPSLAAFSAGFLVLAWGSSTTTTVLAGVLCGGGLGYAFPIQFATVVERSTAFERGSAMAAFTVFLDLGALAGSPLLGWVISLAGYRAMFITAAATVALGAGLLFVSEKRLRDAVPVPEHEPA